MKKKTIKKWYHQITKSMDSVKYDYDEELKLIADIRQSDKKPLSKSLVNKILNNKSFQSYLSNHWGTHHSMIITKCSECNWFSIWWYKYPDIKHANKHIKYRFVEVNFESRYPELYVYEEKNRTEMYN